MNWYKLIVYMLLSVFAVFIQSKAYGRLTDNTMRFKIMHYIFIVIAGVVITINTYFNNSVTRALVSYIVLLCTEYLIYKDSLSKTLTYGTIEYIIVIASEIVLDIFFISIKLIDLESIDNSIINKIFFSLLVALPPYFIVNFGFIKKFSKKVEKLMNRSFSWLILIIIFLVALDIIAFRNVFKISLTNYIGNVLLLIIFSILVGVIFYNKRKAEKEVEKTKILLDFIAEYEKQIDEDRIGRHDVLNNLLILKSYSNKNSLKYNETLNEIIDRYSKKNIKMKNIYKLPSGLKGIIYYKLSDIKNTNAVINISISKQLSTCLENLDNKTYASICKIVGITFDNAIEAALKCDKKIITFDVYQDNDKIIIEITNTFKGKVDIKMINNKNYSTNGKNRGLGLYIVKNLVKNNKDIDIEQKTESNIFITKIYINK